MQGGGLWLLLECMELRLLCAAAPEHQREQAERVRALYKRRLSVPLVDMEAAHARYGADDEQASGSRPLSWKSMPTSTRADARARCGGRRQPGLLVPCLRVAYV